ASCARASVRSPSVSNMIAAGAPLRISVRTTGSGASIRSPEKPAPQPTNTLSFPGNGPPLGIYLNAAGPAHGKPAPATPPVRSLPALQESLQIDLSDVLIDSRYEPEHPATPGLSCGGRVGQLRRGGRAHAPVAAGPQRGDPQARVRAQRAPVRSNDAPRLAHRRGRRAATSVRAADRRVRGGHERPARLPRAAPGARRRRRTALARRAHAAAGARTAQGPAPRNRDRPARHAARRDPGPRR